MRKVSCICGKPSKPWSVFVINKMFYNKRIPKMSVIDAYTRDRSYRNKMNSL